MLQFSLPSVPPGGHRLQMAALAGDGSFHAAGYSDGSIRQALGTSAYVLKGVDGAVLAEGSQRFPGYVRDSNAPELRGILQLLEAAERAGVRRLVCMSDSYQALQVVSSAVAGKPSNYEDVPKILVLLARFESVELRNIANRHNAHADALCTSAHASPMHGAAVKSAPKPRPRRP